MLNLLFKHKIDLSKLCFAQENSPIVNRVSKTIDYEDWYTTPKIIIFLKKWWGEITIYRFGSSKTHNLKRVHSKFFCPKRESINAFSFDLSHETIYLYNQYALFSEQLVKPFLHQVNSKSNTYFFIPALCIFLANTRDICIYIYIYIYIIYIYIHTYIYVCICT